MTAQQHLATACLTLSIAAALSAGCRSLAGVDNAVLDSAAIDNAALATLPAANVSARPIAPVPAMAVSHWQPSHYRNWKPDLAVLPYAEFDGDTVTVHNVRNADYITENDYLLHYDDRTYDLSEVESVYFFVVPFTDTPALAHTMLSFGFADGRYLAISVEVRLEQHESYSPLLGALRQYELMYVVADERDVVRLRTEQRKVDVYMYKARTTPEQTRSLLVDMLRRANEIYRKPEFYDTLTNNCTTNIVDHIDHLAPGKISPTDPRVLLPGYSDELAYDLGLLDTNVSFAETRRRALINRLCHRYRDDEDFSEKIRQ